MTAVIDLDQIDEAPAAPTLAADISFKAWLHAWAPNHPAALGSAIAAIGGFAAAFIAVTVGLAVLWLRPPAPAHPAPPTADGVHSVSVGTPAGAEVSKTVVYHDSTGNLVVRGEGAAELIGDEPASLYNLAAVVVTVKADHASCAITVDGVIADQAEGPASVTCVWVTPKIR